MWNLIDIMLRVKIGFPVQSHAEWLRMQASMKHLPEMYKKFRQLEKKLAKYESK